MASKTCKGEKFKRANTYEKLSASWRIMNVEQHSGMGRKKFSNREFKRRVRL